MRKLGIPSGSLQESTIRLLEKVGIFIRVNGRKFKIEIKNFSLFGQVIIMRPQDIPKAVADGLLDAGLCGWDWVVENEMDHLVEKIGELWYSKKTHSAVKVVVIGKTKELRDGPDVRVTSEYPILARRIFPQAKIDFSHGGSEQKVAYLGYDYAVCVTETGKSIVENGLHIVKVILKSPTVLIAQERDPEIVRFWELLQGGLTAEQYVLLKMNVSEERLSDVLAVIPAFNSPTVNDLRRGGFAVEALVKKTLMAELIIRLREKGAEGIIAHNVDVVL